ncbi:MAG: peptidylprolyl isomerase [Clostridia bacterium]|nr:peptidylprolyl isomerase [Clostridia bacterium]
MGKDNKIKDENKEEKKVVKEKKVETKKAEVKEVKEVKVEEKKIDAKEEKALIKKAKKAANKDTKIILSIVAIVILIAFGIFGFYFYKVNIDYVVSYDGGKVTKADYKVYYSMFAQMLTYYGYPESEIPNQIAEKASLDGILAKAAKDAGVEITEEDKAAIETVFKNQENLDSFKAQGLDIGRVKKLYYNDYLITAYMDKLADEATDEQMLEYIKANSDSEDIDLNEYNTQHILFKLSDSEGKALDDAKKAEVKIKAEQVLQRAKAGEDFASLVKEFSEDSGTAEKEGKYTFCDNGNTMEEFVKAAKSLNNGEIYASLVETSAGYHIIKLESKVENGRLKNATERDEYVNKLINNIKDEKNVKVDVDALNKLIKEITGKDPSEKTDDTTDKAE